MGKKSMKAVAYMFLVCLLLSGCTQTESTVIQSTDSEVFMEKGVVAELQNREQYAEESNVSQESNAKKESLGTEQPKEEGMKETASEEEMEMQSVKETAGVDLGKSEGEAKNGSVNNAVSKKNTTEGTAETNGGSTEITPQSTPKVTEAPKPEPTPQIMEEPEYPKVDANPNARNKEIVEDALWRARLLGNDSFSISEKDLYYASKDVTREERKQVIYNLSDSFPEIKEIRFSSTNIDGEDTYGEIEILMREKHLFGSGQKFDDKYEAAAASSMNVQNTAPILSEISELNSLLKAAIDSMTDEEYVKWQAEIYNFWLKHALECDMSQYIAEEVPYFIQENHDISYEEFLDFFAGNSAFYEVIECCKLARTDEERWWCWRELSATLCEETPKLSFSNILMWSDSSKKVEVTFKVPPVYETIHAEDGTIIQDKTKYKSIATIAKEMDDRLNGIISEVIDQDMSMFAKEYALFHFCDTFYQYDADDGNLGEAYAIYDNPYTVVKAIAPDTGKKETGQLYLHTTVMTGWGVCVQHAQFFQLLCMKAGIPCRGMAGSNHEWNVVTINGTSYLVDVGKRAPFPHFNISNAWKDTYEVVDKDIYDCVKDEEWFINSSYPTSLYQAGYVEHTTQQDGEWIYYINFNDNGSLYKVNVDGSGNEKVCDSTTTIPEAYTWVAKKMGEWEPWEKQWADAQYGHQYSTEIYTNPGALEYRYAFGMNFHVEKENGNIIYRVENVSKTEVIPMTFKAKDIIVAEAKYASTNDWNMGIITGYATVDTDINSGDTISRIWALVDGIEYPVKELTIQSDRQRVNFSFQLPTDKGMESHELEILVASSEGAVKRIPVVVGGNPNVGIREHYLWKGKYYSIEKVISDEESTAVFFYRYTEDMEKEGFAVLETDGQAGKNGEIIPFHTYKEREDVFCVVVGDGEYIRFQLSEDDRIVVECKKESTGRDLYFVDNNIYIFNAKGFCQLAEYMENGEYLDATVEVCGELDFSVLPNDVSFRSIGTEDYPFTGDWHGNNYKIKNLTLNEEGNVSIFAYVEDASLKDVCVCDCNISGTGQVGILGTVSASTIANFWIENVYIRGDIGVGTIGKVFKSDVKNICMTDIVVQGNSQIGAVCGYAALGDKMIFGAQVRGDSEIKGDGMVGGIVGSIRSGTINNCYFRGNIYASGNAVGGIVGYAQLVQDISYCINTGKVETPGKYAGGIVGQCLSIKGKLYHLENEGAIQGNQYVGGIVGIYSNTTMDTVVNTGSVSGAEYVGGVFGSQTGTKDIHFCANKGQVTGEKSTGLIGGSVSENAMIYHTLCTPTKNRLTAENLLRMFGAVTEDITILEDSAAMPYMAGRWAYFVTE